MMDTPVDPRRIERLDPAVIAMLRTKTPAERLAMGFASHDLVRLRLAGHFRTLHPEWTDEDVQDAIARRFLRGTV